MFHFLFLLLSLLSQIALANPCGFVHVSSNNRLFSIGSGSKETIFFPIGFNDWYCNGGTDCIMLSTERLNTYFSLMSYHGFNTFRILMDGGNVSRIEDPPGVFRQEWINSMNVILGAAESHGIYLILSFLPTMYDTWNWHDHPYNVDNPGGLVQTVDDMLTDPGAVEAFKKRVATAAELWGDRTHILSWELWNEMNNQGDATSRRYWLNEIGSHIKQREMELYGCFHMRSASVNNALARTVDLMDHPELDFTSFHTYDSIHPEGLAIWDGLPGASRLNPLGYLYFIFASSRVALEMSPNRPILGTEDVGFIYSLPFPFTVMYDGYPIEKKDDLFLGTLWASFVGGGAGPNLRWATNRLYGEDIGCSVGRPGEGCPESCGTNCGYRSLSNGKYDYASSASLIFDLKRFQTFLDSGSVFPWDDSTAAYFVWGTSTSTNSSTVVLFVDRLNDLDDVPMQTLSNLLISVRVAQDIRTYRVALFDLRTGLPIYDEVVKLDDEFHEIVIPTSQFGLINTFALAVITPKEGVSAAVIAVAVVLSVFFVFCLVAALAVVVILVLFRRRSTLVKAGDAQESFLKEELTTV